MLFIQEQWIYLFLKGQLEKGIMCCKVTHMKFVKVMNSCRGGGAQYSKATQGPTANALCWNG